MKVQIVHQQQQTEKGWQNSISPPKNILGNEWYHNNICTVHATFASVAKMLHTLLTFANLFGFIQICKYPSWRQIMSHIVQYWTHHQDSKTSHRYNKGLMNQPTRKNISSYSGLTLIGSAPPFRVIDFSIGRPPKFNMEPEKKSLSSSWKPSFSGSMVNFGGV